MRACAASCIRANAVTNSSNSSSEADPNSLQGERCRASSTTPSFRVQAKVFLAHALGDPVPDSLAPTFVSLAGIKILPSTGRLFYAIQSFNLILHARCNGIALQFSIHRQQTIFN